MKKGYKVRRLRLERETLRTLQDDWLEAARGGVEGVNVTEIDCYTLRPKSACTTHYAICSVSGWPPPV